MGDSIAPRYVSAAYVSSVGLLSASSVLLLFLNGVQEIVSEGRVVP